MTGEEPAGHSGVEHVALVHGLKMMEGMGVKIDGFGHDGGDARVEGSWGRGAMGEQFD